ncbi:methyl-accepting chemotaxis protein [Psychromonas sp. psych-6C06]|uniref:methyl-accepting chemotaxis protein n=1 Tax=Psychromonas sp. psych-6C06 TaxID=2058089 RepID=UPI000C326885|nr:methyl-accepting chemotaxis protein [Psychromonas sp. psych-6C06]PKF60903.1 methyl-accepting chemotaxis protein [Psychromonas sp. psych-6C06]
MLIKHKLIANTVISIASMLAMLLLLNFSSSALQKDITLAQDIGEIESGILQLRHYEKNFIAQKLLTDVDDFTAQDAKVVDQLEKVKRTLVEMGISTSEIATLSSALTEYRQQFNVLVESQQRIGLTTKDGLYGALTKAVKQVERSIGKSDFEMLSLTLQLRRYEKDFLMDFDRKHIRKYERIYKQLLNGVEDSSLSIGKKTAVNYSLPKYKKAFLDLAAEQKVFGYDAQSGLRKALFDSSAMVIQQQNALVVKTNVAIDSYIKSISSVTYVLFAIALILSIVIGSIVSRSIMSGITFIKRSIVQIAETNDLTIVVSTKNNDELAEMAHAFNGMIKNFHALIISTQESANNVTQAATTLTANIHQAHEGVQAQMQETDMVATAVTEMVATIEEIASNTTDAADKAEQTNQNAAIGKQGVDATIEQINILSGKLVESEDVVINLSKDSETIGSVLDVIRGIAEQTNLLALNAAIEAARAGEQGRGFAVVADEVRTLASRTQESTKEIENIISSLQSRTQNIVSLMTDCREEGKESAEQANQAGQMLAQINEDIVGIMDMNTAIATAIQEQSVVAAEVNRHVVSIRDVAENSGETSTQNDEMSNELETQANKLISEVSKFTV